MKQFKLKEISNLLNIPTNTIRRWLLKPIQNEVYHKDVWNQNEMRVQLRKYDLDYEKLLGCKVDEIELIKSTKGSLKEYVDLEDIEINQTIILHNYSLETTLTLVEVKDLNDTQLYLFFNEEKGEYKTYTNIQLSKPNFKFELTK